ncbi:MAG: hypothetical protein JXX28_10410 [Deltaproteobacteria bacterium]|nr:hypothetical protein [Deltaproteobacteria bacterium]
MASNTKQTTFRRKLRANKMGASRKAYIRAHGTTPVFPVHSADAVANAPAAQLAPAKTEG